jgi:hypothetical protein
MHDQMRDISVSLVGDPPISLPLEHSESVHVHITIPFSLLVQDFDPNTTQVPQWERPRCWLATRLFGRRYETPTTDIIKVCLLAFPIFEHRVWSKLSVLLFGKEERRMNSNMGSDATEWERASASNLFWVFSKGVTDDDIDHVRAVVLKASPSMGGTSGMLFTVEEMGEREK